jgi:hypothetical protein
MAIPIEIQESFAKGEAALDAAEFIAQGMREMPTRAFTSLGLEIYMALMEIYEGLMQYDDAQFAFRRKYNQEHQA